MQHVTTGAAHGQEIKATCYCWPQARPLRKRKPRSPVHCMTTSSSTKSARPVTVSQLHTALWVSPHPLYGAPGPLTPLKGTSGVTTVATTSLPSTLTVTVPLLCRRSVTMWAWVGGHVVHAWPYGYFAARGCGPCT